VLVPQRVRPIFPVALIAPLAGVLLAGCFSIGGSAAAPEVTYQTYSYTCCSAGLNATVWHPGQAIRVTWKAVPQGRVPAANPAGLTLTMLLTGPYADVSTLKSAISANGSPARPGGRAPAATAPAIHTTDRAGGAPVSVLMIPRDAAPGYYNLQFTVASGGGSMSGATIIQVAR
jgi:hypothetical protein